MGDREANLRFAIAELDKFAEDFRVSSFYETVPVGYLDQPDFLNAAAYFQCAFAPVQLLEASLEIERHAGRDRSTAPPQGPRTLDLDILLLAIGGIPLVLNLPQLTVPHPRLHERRFVLAPLAEISPQALHPARGETIARMLANL